MRQKHGEGGHVEGLLPHHRGPRPGAVAARLQPSRGLLAEVGEEGVEALVVGEVGGVGAGGQPRDDLRPQGGSEGDGDGEALAHVLGEDGEVRIPDEARAGGEEGFA